jgi:membrane-bound lytic murein transglycosylase B
MYKSLPTLFITALILLISAMPVTANADPEEYKKYEQRLNELKEYFRSEGMVIDQLLEDSRFEVYETIGDRFKNSAERKTVSLEQYKGILGFEAKKTQIAVFMDENREQLEKAEQEYDIPKYVIAAIIGIESDYGRNIGSYNPFNSYVSMYAVNYRADFARAQLKELIEFVNRKNIDVFELKSSYAGAMSFAQFIPYSINKWWVGDDIFDMNNNIMSVGNYLAYFKERTGSIDRAVFRYNPSELYTSAVLALADEASKM